MATLIKAEIRKMLVRKGVIFTWIFALLIASIMMKGNTIDDAYSDVFFKSYEYTPMMGLLMFMILAGAYTMEYHSNMSDLINSTANGKRNLVKAKGIGAGIATSVVNLSILFTIYYGALKSVSFQGLDTPLKDLWYFKGASANLNVLQMMIILAIAVVAASFFFSQVCLYLSSISKSATLPFLLSGLIMGIPYIVGTPFSQGMIGLTPLWGMIPSQLVKINAGMGVVAFQVLVLIAGCVILPKLTAKAFTKEGRI